MVAVPVMKRLGNALSLCVMMDKHKSTETLDMSTLEHYQSSGYGDSPSSAYDNADPVRLGKDNLREPWALGDSCLYKTETVNSVHSSDAAFVDRRSAREVKQPADGSCLFHALSFGLNDGTDARRLRREIARFIYDNPDMEISGLALKEWIRLDSGRSTKRYAAKIATGAEGGGIELEIFSKLKGRNVRVYERCSGGYRKITSFDGATSKDNPGTVNILYRKRCHYDALVLEREVAKL